MYRRAVVAVVVVVLVVVCPVEYKHHSHNETTYTVRYISTSVSPELHRLDYLQL